MNTRATNDRAARETMILCLTLLICHASAAQTPTIVPIGTLGGRAAQAYSVNGSGQVVGTSLLDDNQTERAFLFSGGVLRDLNTLGGTSSHGNSINDQGQVVGYADTTGDQSYHAFLYSDGVMRDLGTIDGSPSWAVAINPAGLIMGNAYTANAWIHACLYNNGVVTVLGDLGVPYTTAKAINSSGWVVGEAYTTSYQRHACLWKNGTVVDLGTFDGNFSTAMGINDAGLVTGFSWTGTGEQHAFLYDGTTMLDLGTLGGGSSSGYRINKAGDVAGNSSTSTGFYRGFLYTGGRMLDLGTLGGAESAVNDMNKSGQIVGDADDPLGAVKAVLWENGQITDLNSLFPDSGWYLQTAYNISDGGHILGYGMYQGQWSWFLLSLNRAAVTNAAPVAEAGPDQVVECSGSQTAVVLNGAGSHDPDGDSLTYAWYYGSTLLSSDAAPTLAFGLGTYAMTLRVTDPSGASSDDSVTIQVVDTTPPVVICPGALTLAADGQCGAAVPDLLGTLAADDACTPGAQLVKTQTPGAGSRIGLGQNTVAIQVVDAAGNATACSTVVTVVDSTPPVIQSITATPAVLGPPSRQMVSVTVSVVGSDTCDTAPTSRIIDIQSSEPATGPGDNTSPDWVITGPLTADLRSEGANSQRTYTLTVECRDASGNTAVGTVTVIVDNGKKKTQTPLQATKSKAVKSKVKVK